MSSPSPHAPKGIGGGQSFAAPGVIGRSWKSAALMSLSVPSWQRDRPAGGVAPASTSPAPEPSVYGATVFPS